ncbi:MAG: GDP-mannose 4,6-dehydratase [Isosphaeraceae bacterium]
MRVLVTGASGFVGGHLCEHLLAAGDLVVGLSASGRWPRALAHLEQSVRLERGDLADVEEAQLVDWLRRKQPEVVYHLAAQSNPSASLTDPRGTWALNLGGTLNLLEAVKAAGLKPGPRVIVVSSGVCYGNPAPEHLPVDEHCPLRPMNPYAASKAAADLLGIQHFLAYGTDVVIVRPFNHAGPRQSPTYVLAGLARQVADVEAGRREHVEVGNLDVVRDFTDVRDVVRGYHLLAHRGEAGEIYNLGSGRGTKLADALEHLRGLARRPIRVEVDPARVRPVDQPLLVASPAKLRAATGWEPQFSMEQTLADTLDLWRTEPGEEA